MTAFAKPVVLEWTENDEHHYFAHVGPFSLSVTSWSLMGDGNLLVEWIVTVGADEFLDAGAAETIDEAKYYCENSARDICKRALEKLTCD